MGHQPASGFCCCCTEEYPSSTEQLLRVYLSTALEGLRVAESTRISLQGNKSCLEELPAAALLGGLLVACLPSGCQPDTLCGRLYLLQLLETLPMRARTNISSRFSGASLFRHSQPFVPAIRQFGGGLFELSDDEMEGGTEGTHYCRWLLMAASF